MMNATAVCTVPPAAEPVTLDEMKAHLEVSTSDRDDLIAGAIKAAREQAEAIARRVFITSTWRFRWDAFPACPARWLDLPRAPVQAVSAVSYIDPDGVTRTWSPSLWQVDTDAEPARLMPVWGESWPAIRAEMGAVTVLAVCGYPGDGSSPEDLAANVPAPFKAAVKLIAAELFERREDAIAGAPIAEVPVSARRLLLPKKIWSL